MTTAVKATKLDPHDFPSFALQKIQGLFLATQNIKETTSPEEYEKIFDGIEEKAKVIVSRCGKKWEPYTIDILSLCTDQVNDQAEQNMNVGALENIVNRLESVENRLDVLEAE